MNLPWCVLIFFCNVSKGFSLCFTFCRFMPCGLTNDCLINFHKFPQKSEKNKNMWALYTTAVIAHVLVLSLTQNVTAKHDHAKCWASLFYYFTISPRQTYYNAVIKTTWNGVDWLCFRSISFFFGFVIITPEVIFLHGWLTVVEMTSSLLPKNWLQVSHHTKLEHRFHKQGITCFIEIFSTIKLFFLRPKILKPDILVI